MTNDIVKKVIENGRGILVNKWMSKSEFKDLVENNDKLKEYIAHCTSPDTKDIFNAFTIGTPEEVKVLILGQDPYPDEKYPKKADGYAFSQNGKNPVVDSLRNIYEALAENFPNDTFDKNNCQTSLSDWAKDNKVLLLNTALTYRANENHFNSWEPFIKQIISNLIKTNSIEGNFIIYLWGVPAQQIFYSSVKSIEEYTNRFLEILGEDNKENLKNGKLVNLEKSIKIGTNKIFMTSHPCNRSKWRGFSKNAPNHFKACDDFLSENDDNRVWKNLWKYIKSPTKP